MPTILDPSGVPRENSDGVSLKPLLVGEPIDAQLDAYTESLYPERFGWSRLRALRGERFKLIVAPGPELYDLQQDPGEHHNQYVDRPQLAAAMAARLTRFGSADAALAAHAMTEEQKEALRALGYVGFTRDTPQPDAVLRDPKDFINTINEAGARRQSLAPCLPESAKR
jgi:arylsulfatase A-like enzyme